MLHITITDDNHTDTAYLTALVGDWAEASGNEVHLTAHPSAESFLLSDSACDILLLDVEMKAMSGIDLAKAIRKNSTGRKTEIIFITSHFEFCGEGYEVDALHYLIKPVSAERLYPVLDKAAAKVSESSPTVLISCDGETVRLPTDEILYVESDLHYLTIHTVSGEYRVREKLSAFEERLTPLRNQSGGEFFRIHRSYLASLRHITKISRTSVTIGRKTELPLARGNYDAVNRAYIAYYS